METNSKTDFPDRSGLNRLYFVTATFFLPETKGKRSRKPRNLLRVGKTLNL